MRKEIVIKTKQDSVLDAFGYLLLGGLFIFVGIYFYNRNELFSLLIMVLSFKFYIYQMIDLWAGKTFIIDGEKLYIKCWGIKFKLDKERSFLRIDNMWVLSNINAKHPTLNIHRNPTSWWGRIFKNQIKLYPVDKYNIKKAEPEAQDIADRLGIKFHDIYTNE